MTIDRNTLPQIVGLVIGWINPLLLLAGVLLAAALAVDAFVMRVPFCRWIADADAARGAVGLRGATVKSRTCDFFRAEGARFVPAYDTQKDLFLLGFYGAGCRI